MAVLKLLRNQTLYATHEAALTAIDQMAANLHDGELWVATYGTSPNAKSILALKRTDGLTVFDNDASSATITAAINALDATVGSTTVENGKHVAVQVVEENGVLTSLTINEKDIASAALLGQTTDTKENQTAFGYIAKEVADRTAAIQALDKTDTPEAKKFVTSVSETDGIISVSRGEVTSADKTVKVTGSADGSIDLAVNVDGTTIVKTGGKLAVGTVPAEQVSVAAGTGLEATKAQAAFKELKDKIDKVGGNAKSYTIVKQTDGLDSKVREQYRLQQTVGSTTEFVGDTIQIYKDSAYKEIYLGTANDTVDPVTGTITKAEGDKQSLNYVYIKADGTYDIANVDVSNFLAESEFKDGLVVTDHVVKVKVDASSEGFLTVGENGVKLSGVQDTINAAVEALDVTDAAEDGMYVSAVSETDGKVAITRANVADAVLNGYAKGSAPLSGQEAVAATDDVKGAIAKLEHQVDAAKAAVANKNVEAEGDIYVKATASDNKVTVATQIKRITFTPGSEDTDSKLECAGGLINGSDAVINVTRFVNARIGEEIAKLDSVATSSNGQNVDVKVTQVDGKITSVDITSDLTINRDEFDAEVTARRELVGQNGDTYTANSSSNYIKNATSLNDADVKLDAALKTADDAMLTGVTGSDAITVSAKTNKNQTISLKLDTATKPAGFTNADNVLSITSEGLYLSSIIDCGTY